MALKGENLYFQVETGHAQGGVGEVGSSLFMVVVHLLGLSYLLSAFFSVVTPGSSRWSSLSLLGPSRHSQGHVQTQLR